MTKKSKNITREISNTELAKVAAGIPFDPIDYFERRLRPWRFRPVLVKKTYFLEAN